MRSRYNNRLFIILLLGIFHNLYGYNRNQVARYADKWSQEGVALRNPFFYSCSKDCANFVSQCLIAGGIDLKDGPSYDYTRSQ